MNAKEKCYKITTAFEGGGGFSNITGNFDGQGISFGFLQWNLGQGTLQPLLLEMFKNGPQTFLRLTSAKITKALLTIAKLSPKDAVAYSIMYMQKRTLLGKWILNPEYKQAFQNLGKNEVFRHIQMRFADKGPMARAEKDLEWLGLATERALALCFDIAVQNGGLRAAHKLLINKKLKDKELLKSVAKAVASCSKKQFYKDVLSRKMCIVEGYGKVHGRFFDLEKTFELSDKKIDKPSASLESRKK